MELEIIPPQRYAWTPLNMDKSLLEDFQKVFQGIMLQKTLSEDFEELFYGIYFRRLPKSD